MRYHDSGRAQVDLCSWNDELIVRLRVLDNAGGASLLRGAFFPGGLLDPEYVHFLLNCGGDRVRGCRAYVVVIQIFSSEQTLLPDLIYRSDVSSLCIDQVDVAEFHSLSNQDWIADYLRLFFSFELFLPLLLLRHF